MNIVQKRTMLGVRTTRLNSIGGQYHVLLPFLQSFHVSVGFLVISRATIGLEPKIRTTEENLIILRKKKTIVSVCKTKVRSCRCLFIFRNHLLYRCLILDFLLGIVTENVFSLAYFLNQLNAKPSLQHQLS